MRDLGTLGGTMGFANWMNDRGEVVGQSNLAGDQTSHPFLWDGKTMIDLGTLGGDLGFANSINEAGAVVGDAWLPDGTHHGFLWKNGVMQDLLPVAGARCSNAFSVNDRGDVVGNATDCHGNAQTVVLWRNGSPLDLTSLIAPSGLQLTEPNYISDRGEIVGLGVLPNGDQRV